MKLCPYHEDNLGWDSCSEGFEGCEIDQIEDCGGIHTHRGYWDCECKNHYIHSKEKGNYCPYCGIHEEDGMPDSRVNEIQELYDPKYDMAMNKSYEELP
jgi:hypothetical protein